MNIKQYRGTNKTLPVTITKTVGGVTTPFDLTGYTATLTIKKKKSDADVDAVVIKAVTVHTDAPNGVTQFEVDAVDTSNMEFDDYVYDIQVELGAVIKTIIVGHWEIQEKVKD